MKKLYFLLSVLATTFTYAQPNLITNGTFDNNGAGWSTFIAKSDSAGTVSVSGGNASITSTNAVNWDNFGIYQEVTLNPGIYIVDFDISFNGIDDSWGELLLGDIEPENGKDYKVGATGADEIAALSWIEEIYNTWDCSNGTQNNPDITSTGPNNDGSVESASTYIAQEAHSGGSCDTNATEGSLNFEITTAGTYYIVFKTGNWEGSLGSTGVTIDNVTLYDAATLNTTNFETQTFSIVPNPTANTWSVTANNQKMEAIEIFDLQGKKVKTLTPNNTSVNIDASDLSAGIYLMNITTNSGTTTKKLIKQ